MKPSPSSRPLRLLPAPTEPRSHVEYRFESGGADLVTPVVAAALVFDWADHPDKPVMPTLVACAIDRIGQHLENPLLVTRGQAFEALRAIRTHYRDDSDDCSAVGIARPL